MAGRKLASLSHPVKEERLTLRASQNSFLTFSAIDEIGQIHEGEDNVTNNAKMYTGKLLICDLPEASTFSVLVASTDERALWFHPTRIE